MQGGREAGGVAINTNAKGAHFERKTKTLLESEGWLVTRAAGSLGDADLVALRLGDKPQLVEVKANSTGGAYKTFGPADRKQLRTVAAAAGSTAILFWWPGGRRKVERIEAGSWPK